MKIQYKTNLELLTALDFETDDSYNFKNTIKTLDVDLKFKLEGEVLRFSEVEDTTSIESVLALVGKTVKSEEYRNVRYKLKRAERVAENKYQCSTVFEDKNEVVFMEVKGGKFSIVLPKDFIDSSIVTIEGVSNLFYFIVKNEFTISPLNYYSPTPLELYKISTGFYNLVTLRKGLEPTITIKEDSILYTPKATLVESGYSFRIDSRPVFKYQTYETEHSIIECDTDVQEFENFKHEDLKGNAVVLYTYKDQKLVFDRLLIAASMNSFGFTSTETEDLKNIDVEFKKNYFFRIYKTPVNIGTVKTVDLFNVELLAEIEKNKTLYAKKALVVNGL